MKTVNELIKDINSLTSHLHEKDFLLTWEQTPDELKQVLDVAAALKALRAENISTKVFNSGLGISVFRDNSTRTRFSYASALNLLGLAQQDLDEGKSQIAHGETVRETANMISFCADAIGIRCRIYLYASTGLGGADGYRTRAQRFAIGYSHCGARNAAATGNPTGGSTEKNASPSTLRCRTNCP